MPPDKPPPLPALPTYRSVRGWTIVLIELGLLSVLVSLICVASAAGMKRLVERAARGQEIRAEEQQAAAAKLNLLILLAVCCDVVVTLSLLAWLYVSHQQLAALGASPARSSLAALLWHFVPIVNLFMHLAVLLEIWTGSDPAALSGRKRETPPTIVYIAWGLMMFATIAAILVLPLAVGPPTPASAARLLHWSIGLMVVSAAHSAALVIMVVNIHRMQDQRAQLLEAEASPSQPLAPLHPSPAARDAGAPLPTIQGTFARRPRSQR